MTLTFNTMDRTLFYKFLDNSCWLLVSNGLKALLKIYEEIDCLFDGYLSGSHTFCSTFLEYLTEI